MENLEKTVNELTNNGEGKRLEHLGKLVHALTRKVLELQGIINDMKNQTVKDKEVLNENLITEDNFFDHYDIKHSSSTPKAKDVEEKVQKDKSKQELFKCKECEYKSEKEVYLKKHMGTIAVMNARKSYIHLWSC